MNNGGRPAGRMTVRRRQAFDAITEAAANGEQITLSRLARKLGTGYDYRNAKRIVRDLQSMGKIQGLS